MANELFCPHCNNTLGEVSDYAGVTFMCPYCFK